MSLNSLLHPPQGVDSSTGNSGDAASAGQPTSEEVARIRRRRKLARKTPEQRHKLLQYQRRHNEKDERLLYCDYCDLFISARQKTWAAHLRSARHTESFHAYYDLAAHVESVWLGEINHKIELARSREVHRAQQARAGHGSATPLPTYRVGPGIVVGGAPAPTPTLPLPPPPPPAVLARVPTIAVGSVVLPPIRVGGKVLAAPPVAVVRERAVDSGGAVGKEREM